MDNTEAPNFGLVEYQYKQATELSLIAGTELNDVTAQMTSAIAYCLKKNDASLLRQTDEFMKTVLWDCGDEFHLEPEGVINLMEFYPQNFTAEQVQTAASMLVAA